MYTRELTTIIIKGIRDGGGFASAFGVSLIRAHSERSKAEFLILRGL
jgi:hypothetical protein